MNYIPNTESDRTNMLYSLGLKTTEDLFRDIPSSAKAKTNPDIPDAADEIELMKELKDLSEKNIHCGRALSFMGGGAYRHFIPSAVKHAVSRSEFLTAYTPYQAEMSQGLLQAIYEYQTMICNLFGMGAANASHYDGGTALAEAAVASCNHTGRDRVLVSRSVNPAYRQVLKTYSLGGKYFIEEAPVSDGRTDLEQTKKLVTEKTACFIVQMPNFFGNLEDVFEIEKAVHAKGGLFVVSVDPISLGLLAKPAEYGADIVTAEGQSLGSELNFGGPYLGIFAAKNEFVRMIPGRIVGKTTDHDGNSGFVLTLQAREQHIRREKASSNICSNQAHVALTAAAYLSYVGEKGLETVANTCRAASAYAYSKISSIKGFSVPFGTGFYKEFAVKLPVAEEKVKNALLNNGILAGPGLGRLYPELKGHMLFCFTEMNTKNEIDRLISVLSNV
ncbi:MAG: aminomethyl-transferring glycine dehydrogenase subunit GcvPA [Candidatus Margulisiibacteriota bacterium]